MKNKKILKFIAIIVVAGIIVGGSIAFYLFNMPHRDVQSTSTDYKLTTTEIVNDYLSNAENANEKYLAEDGESKVLEITGIIKKITEDYNGNKVILLQDNTDKAGVSCSFTPESNQHASNLSIGDKITLKGVIRSGASYDEDLEMYENVILEKCDIIQ